MTALRSGRILLLDRRASPQFVVRPLRLRLVAVLHHITYDGWVWLAGYALDQRGTATGRREVYVRWAGIIVETDAGPVPVTTAPKPPPAPKVGAPRLALRVDRPRPAPPRAPAAGPARSSTAAARGGTLSRRSAS